MKSAAEEILKAMAKSAVSDDDLTDNSIKAEDMPTAEDPEPEENVAEAQQ